VDVFDPNPYRAQPFATPAGTNDIRVNTVAAYLNDTVHLNRQWQISGGVRVEHYTAGVSSKDVLGLPTGTIDNFSATETTVGGKLALVYKPYDNVSLYAAAGLSHDPPAGNLLSNPDISRSADGDAFPNLIPGADPVRVVNYEIGSKWDFFNGRLSATAALFHTDKRVSITGCDPNCAVDPESLKGYAHQIAQGIELTVAGNITDDWKVFGGLLWMRTERDISAYLDMVRSNANRGDYGCPAIPAPCTVRTDGDSLAFTPNFSANLWTTYHIPTTKWTVGAGMQYVGSSWAGRPDDARRIIKNGVFGKLPSYFLVNAMVSYEVYKDVDVRFNVDNIADVKYAMSTNWAARRAILGAPRTYRMSMNFRF
jgi:catecholate siderophore receptor